jgi:homopolymeric O-antigen transport system ATP-binding protein
VTEPIVVLEGVSKSYPAWAPGERSLRSVFHRRLPALRRFGEQRYALQDINLQAMPGESLGIIGANGAGKSTLLRLVSGLTYPTRGRITTPSNTASVLTLGDAFALEQSGAENAVTGAIIGGMRRFDAYAALPAVLEFAELEAFAEAPMRTYSEGMKLRLAFGIVAQLQPDLLVLDEVMAVGDARFQLKCTARVRELRDHGTTVLFASHNLELVAEECDRALWVDDGQVRAQGPAVKVVGDYRESMDLETLARTPDAEASPSEDDEGLELGRNRLGSQEVTVEKVRMVGTDEIPGWRVRPGERISIRFSLRANTPSPKPPIVAVAVYRRRDMLTCWDLSTERDGVPLFVPDPEVELQLDIDHVDLLPGDYVLEIGAYRDDWAYAYDFHRQAYPFTVEGRAQDSGLTAPLHSWSHGSRSVGVQVADRAD